MTLNFSEAKQQGRELSVLTAYDYPTAKLLEEVGIDLILVGDSLGMVVLGYPDTTHVTMEEMEHHCRAVARGVTKTPVLADLPIHSYETSADALRNARRLMAAGANAVKLEGALTEQIKAIVSEGIPVMGHLGMLPQRVLIEGGYSTKGKSESEAQELLQQAVAVEQAGAFALVLELVKPETAQLISSKLSIPTVGIGSGTHCDGQVLVTHDLAGAFPWFKPRFVSRQGDVAGEIRKAATQFIQQTRSSRL